MKTLIKGGWVVDPSQDIDEPLDILIEYGKIEKLQKDIQIDDCRVIDARNKYVVPGLIDMHVHFREPGFEEKETIEAGAMAAAAGGFTSVVCMPNTNPVIDNRDVVNSIKEKAKGVATNVYMMGSITKDLQGEVTNSYEDLKEAGVLGITDDGKTVMNAGLMYKAMEAAQKHDLIVSTHCEDTTLVYDRSINRGRVSESLGLEGVPSLAEELIIARDLLLAEYTDVKLHIQHISTKKGVELVREAKKKGIRVSCEAAPHHFTLTDEMVIERGTNAKMSPPLRTREDVEAIIEGLLDNTIDAIATDHAPHTLEDKDKSLIESANGIVGLETALGLAITELVHKRGMPLKDLIRKLSFMPAKLLNIQKGTLEIGKDADVTVIDMGKNWVVNPRMFYSKGRNTPFEGWKLTGKAILTMVAGEITYKHE